MNVPRSIWYMYYRTEPSRLVLWEWCAQLLCAQLLCGCVRHCHSAYATFPLLSPEIEDFINAMINKKILLELNVSYYFLGDICDTLPFVERCSMVPMFLHHHSNVLGIAY